MAARGARSRKVLDKDIQKKEFKRDSASDYSYKKRIKAPNALDDFEQRTSGSLSPQPLKPHSITHSGRQTSQGARPRSVSGISSISSLSEGESRALKAKREGTAAPRGRGGGVPAKPFIQPLRRINSVSRVQQLNVPKEWLRTSVWSGDGRMLQQYGGFENDPDMWMEDGDCHIFFTGEDDTQSSKPSMCLHVRQLERAKSTLLNNLLRYSALERDDDMISSIPNSGLRGPGLPRRKASYRSVEDSPADFGFQWDSRDLPLKSNRFGSSTARSSKTAVSRDNHLQAIHEPMHSPLSETASSVGDASYVHDITHEMWFPAPPYLKTAQDRRRHHLAQRNFFALLYNKPLVGADFFEMLEDLHGVITTFYELDNCVPGMATQMIIRFLLERKLDDVRNNVKMALGLLAWSEREHVRWQQGYMEAFVHCAGMMTPKVADSPEFRRLSTVTRHNLDNAAGMLQLKVMEAEEKLASFEFADMLPALKTKDIPPWQRSFVAFQEFLVAFYRIVFATWPPEERRRSGTWLTRDIAERLQTDFGAAYDFFVDRSVSWEAQEARSTNKWEMVSKSGGQTASRIDPPGMPLTDILVGFDNAHAYLHIPHPHPLVPPPATPSTATSTSKKSFFSTFKKPKVESKDQHREQLHAALAFSDATNLDKLGTKFEANDLVDQIVNYEKAADLKGVGAQDARLGRWILLYGILQTLSTLSIHANGTRHTDGVDYFLCPSLKNCPPWDTKHPLSITEATQTDSYCWLAPSRWEGRQPNKSRDGTITPLELDASSFPPPGPPPAPGLPPLPTPPSADTDPRKPRSRSNSTTPRLDQRKDSIAPSLPRLDTMVIDEFRLDPRTALSSPASPPRSQASSPVLERLAKYREMSPHIKPLQARQLSPSERNAFASAVSGAEIGVRGRGGIASPALSSRNPSPKTMVVEGEKDGRFY